MSYRVATEGLRLLLAIACAVAMIALALLWGPDAAEPVGCASDVKYTEDVARAIFPATRTSPLRPDRPRTT